MSNECISYNPSSFVLTFDNTPIGVNVHAVKTVFRRVEGVARKQNFWSSSVVLDGRYPALVWDHEFTIYMEDTDRFQFMKQLYGLSSRVTEDPKDLRIKVGSTTLVAYGNCYMEDVNPADPTDQLLYQAGTVQLHFVGTSIPSIVS